MPVSAAPKIGFVSLGCPKALVDSERIITELSRDGYQVASDYDGADLVVVNTCGFIESAVLFAHGLDDVVYMWIWIDIMQAYPNT